LRYLLERGRAYNSGGQADRACEQFHKAWELGISKGEDFYAIDAAHMLGICAVDDAKLRWNLDALTLADSSTQPRARNWLGSLYDNIGWTYHDLGQYASALEYFERGLAWQTEQNKPRERRIALWTVGRAVRSLGRIDEALLIQQSLFDEIGNEGESDGYVNEELVECLLLLGRAGEARTHFARAFELLSGDEWLAKREQERLHRLKRLSEVP
jgi:tetratricopeptide (TPR) repeat protein